MFWLRALSRSVVLLALVAACSSSGSATTPPTGAAGQTNGPGASSTPAGTVVTAPGSPIAGVPTVPPAAIDPWVRNATDYTGMNGQKFAFPCPPNGTISTVWGTDTYTDDSSVCTAGVHVGAITLAVGGYVVIQISPGQDNYTGSDRNGVTSLDYGEWGGSYVIIH